MPEKVPDDLEGEISVDESLRAAVTQCVRAGTMYLDAGLAQVVGSSQGNDAMRDRSDGRSGAEEDLSFGRLGAAELEVVQQSLSLP